MTKYFAMLPGWNSLESASRIHTFFEIAGIVCLAALVITEIIALAYGRRRDTLSDAASKQESSLLQGQVKDSQDKLATETEKSKGLKAQVDRLGEERKPRQLSKHQHDVLVEQLKNFETQNFIVRNSPGLEPQQYADEIKAALVDAGWTMNPNPGFRIFEHDGTGIFVVMNDRRNVPEAANGLYNALKAAGLSPGGTENSSVAVGSFELLVGQKPVVELK